MRFANPVCILACALCFAACASSANITPTLPAQQEEAPHVCRLTVILNYQTVCLDGEWRLSTGILGDDATYIFRRERTFLLLVPVLTEEMRKDLRARMNPNTLDTPLERNLSIQGTVHQNKLFFEQYNALVPWQETMRMNLQWRDTHFEGMSETLSMQHRSTSTQKVTLHRKGRLHS